MKPGWEIKKLGEVCEVNYGTRVVQKKDGGTIFPVYGGGGATFRMDTYNRKDCMIVARFAMSSQCVRFVKGKFFLNDSGLTLESKSNSIIQRFLDKQILALNDTIYSLGKGIAQKNLDVRALKQIDIKIPTSISEQERIVEELDLLSGIIEKQKQQLKEYDTLAQSIFYDMFGDPVGNDKGWNIVKFADGCVEIGDGLHGTPNYDVEGTIPFINGTNLIDGRIIVTDRTLFVNETEAMKYRVKMDTNTVLLSINGTLGKTAIYQDENVILGKSACFCRLKKEYFNVVFVERLMNTDYFKKFLEENSSKSTIKNVGLKTIRNYKIVVPSLFLQQEFAEKIEAIEKQKELIKKSLVETETLFNSRMDYYFN